MEDKPLTDAEIAEIINAPEELNKRKFSYLLFVLLCFVFPPLGMFYGIWMNRNPKVAYQSCATEERRALMIERFKNPKSVPRVPLKQCHRLPIQEISPSIDVRLSAYHYGYSAAYLMLNRPHINSSFNNYHRK